MAVLLAAAAAALLVGRASVIDGDTLEIHGQRVRLWGIDAPESRQLCTDPEGKAWRCGQQAALILADHIGSRPVVCTPKQKDRYGRVVATCSVSVKGRRATEDLGLMMVRAGWAFDYRQFSKGHYRAAEGSAREARRGVWAGTVEVPWKWRTGQRSR